MLTRSHYLWKHEPCFMGWRRPNRPPKVAEETLRIDMGAAKLRQG